LPYRIIYSPAAEDHLRRLTARQQAIVLDAVEAQLVHQPTLVTRNRKLLQGNATAAWELRIGILRVYLGVSRN
jgi:mRNA-degrading endonuclease RelE of RelBE toxin-antitoxin system